MNPKNCISLLALVLLLLSGSIKAQESIDKGLSSISADELRGHLFFLASDYLNGRYAHSKEYDLAAQYVAAQFAAAGLEPGISKSDGSSSYFQGVPFEKTSFGKEVTWKILREDQEFAMDFQEDFKTMFGDNHNHDQLSIVWLGYGIEEPEHKWNDFKDLDIRGKIVVCMAGAPMKKGKPVLPKEIHDKYDGPGGLGKKIFTGMFNRGASGIIVVDLDGSIGIPFQAVPQESTNDKYIYKGSSVSEGQRSMPTVYLAQPEFLNVLMGKNKANPLLNPDQILKNYQPQELSNTYLKSGLEILGKEPVFTNNVVGLVRGTDPVLQNEYIVVGAHLDHVRPVNGEACNGADDNASGSSGVMEIAEALVKNPCKRSVVFITYTGEELGLLGSRYFLDQETFPLSQIKFNINLDMIGRSSTKNEESRAHYVVSHKKYIQAIEKFITDVNQGITDFPLLFDNDEDSPGGSDHQSFINKGIPAFFFFSGIHKDLHNPGDDAEKIDYAKAESISRLAYLLTQKLGNMTTVPNFQ